MKNITTIKKIKRNTKREKMETRKYFVRKRNWIVVPLMREMMIGEKFFLWE